MLKGLIFSVQVAQIVLRSLGKIQDCLQIDDLRESGPAIGKLSGKQLQDLSLF